MLHLSTFLSLSRAPLALCFFSPRIDVRIGAILLAMLTDSIDGFFARRYKTTSRFGAILDPVMDKLFVFMALGILYLEGRIALWESGAMLSRDVFLCAFGLHLSLSGHWHAFECRAIRWGKITTALQFLVLIGLSLNIAFPWYLYGLFIIFGGLAFIELCQLKKETKTLPSKPPNL